MERARRTTLFQRPTDRYFLHGPVIYGTPACICLISSAMQDDGDILSRKKLICVSCASAICLTPNNTVPTLIQYLAWFLRT